MTERILSADGWRGMQSLLARRLRGA